MSRDVGKLLATATGVVLCLVALAAWRLPTSGSPPGLDLRLIAVPPGELTLDATGVVASARAMQAGDPPVREVIEVRNIAGRRLLVHPVALPSVAGAARALRLRIAADDAVVASGRLDAHQRGRGTWIEIPARGSRQIEVAAWLPTDATDYRGRILDLTLELRSRRPGETG